MKSEAYVNDKNESISYRVALFDSAVKPFTVTADSENQAEMCQKDPRFIKWLTDWKEGQA